MSPLAVLRGRCWHPGVCGARLCLLWSGFTQDPSGVGAEALDPVSAGPQRDSGPVTASPGLPGCECRPLGPVGCSGPSGHPGRTAGLLQLLGQSPPSAVLSSVA